jgi:hypothetical protein
MSNDLEAATDRVFAAMDDYRTGEAVHATRQVAKALARAALDGVREKALREVAETFLAEKEALVSNASVVAESLVWRTVPVWRNGKEISAAILALIDKAD